MPHTYVHKLQETLVEWKPSHIYTCKTEYIKYIKATRMRVVFVLPICDISQDSTQKTDNLREIPTKDT